MSYFSIDQIDSFYAYIDNINMTLQQLEYVLSVLDKGSFSAAADDCCVTQPTLSAQIAKLEGELGITLIDRVNRPPGVNPGAREIIRLARQAQTLLRQIPLLAGEQRASLGGSLRLGIIHTLGQYLLPRFLRDFLSSCPALKMIIHEMNSDDMLQALKTDEIDVGIMALPTGESGLKELPLFYEEFYAYLPPDFQLNEQGDQIETRTAVQLGRLAWEDMLILSEGHCLRDQIIDLCGMHDVRAESSLAFETGSLESLKSMVNQGLGYTLLPELAALSVSTLEADQVHPIVPRAPSRSIGLVCHPGFVRTTLLHRLSEHILLGLPNRTRNRRPESVIPWRN